MSAWDPWWVHGDYADTYHGAPENEDDEEQYCSLCHGAGEVPDPIESFQPDIVCPRCGGSGEEP